MRDRDLKQVKPGHDGHKGYLIYSVARPSEVTKCAIIAEMKQGKSRHSAPSIANTSSQVRPPKEFKTEASPR
jgi:hypothetical protein